MAAPKKYPDELMDRGVRLVFESGRPIAHVARDLGVSAEALRKRVRCAEVDAGNVANTEGSHEFEPREPVRFVGASIR